MKITPKTVINRDIIHPFSKELRPAQKAVAAVSSGVLFVLTFGTLHYRALKIEKKVKKELEMEQKTKKVVEETIKPPTPLQIEKKVKKPVEQEYRTNNVIKKTIKPPSEKPVVEPQPVVSPVETKLTAPRSPQQTKLYNSLSPLEKNLYDTLSLHQGAFADLVLLIIKGRLNQFQVDDKKNITLDLKAGSAPIKVMGFDLDAKLPGQINLQYSPEDKTMIFLQNFVIEKAGAEILKPKSAVFSDQGVKINAEFHWLVKLTDRPKLLKPPLSSARVFELFS